MEYLIQYGMFLAKSATIVVAIVLVLAAIANTGNRGKRSPRKGEIKINKLNDHYDEMRDEIRHAVLDKDDLKALGKTEKKSAKEQQKLKKKAADGAEAEPERKKRLYVLNFEGDPAAEAVDSLREEITAVLTMAESQDEILLKLESPGGMVHAYGLASSQLERIKSRKIPLTICVDKVAASGGYMMACLADKIVAAPFAYIGSIGVALQLPNFHRVLKNYDVDYETITAGEYKRTVSTFGEITDKARQKVQEEVQEIHDIFKLWVKDHRPSVEIEKIATGETWLGSQAKERYLVDEIRTSDECIASACEQADVYEVEYEIRKSIQDKFSSILGSVSERVINRVLYGANANDKFYS